MASCEGEGVEVTGEGVEVHGWGVVVIAAGVEVTADGTVGSAVAIATKAKTTEHLANIVESIGDVDLFLKRV